MPNFRIMQRHFESLKCFQEAVEIFDRAQSRCLDSYSATKFLLNFKVKFCSVPFGLIEIVNV